MPDISLVVVTAVPIIEISVAQASAPPTIILNSSNLSLQGLPGVGLEYDWRGTELGVRQEGTIDYEYTNLGGAATSSYIHTQMVAATIWTVEHNLGKYPSVTVVDSGNTVVVGEVRYIDTITVVLTFTSSFSGKAYLN